MKKNGLLGKKGNKKGNLIRPKMSQQKRKGSKRKWAEEDHQAETKDSLTTEPEFKNEAISGSSAVGKKTVLDQS